MSLISNRLGQVRENSFFRDRANLKTGGARRDRTDDLMLAKHALYQLSYGPQKVMVGPGRLELPTSRLSGVRSNQAELRAYGGTTARQKPGLAIALPITAGRMPGASWKRKRKEKRRRRRPAVYWSSNRQSRERRPGGTSLERR